MSGGRAPKRKGDAFERSVAKALGGERSFWQPGGGEDRGDIINVPVLGAGECKIRAAGFKQLYGWLEGREFLAIRADRMPALIVMRIDKVAAILEMLEVVQ